MVKRYSIMSYIWNLKKKVRRSWLGVAENSECPFGVINSKFWNPWFSDSCAFGKQIRRICHRLVRKMLNVFTSFYSPH